MSAEQDKWIDRALSGDRRALGQLITAVENRNSGFVEIMSRLHDRGRQSYVMGITGPPGAGKSTLLDRLIARFRQQRKQVGVVAVDPSSPFSGGSVLGDRIRMQSHFLDEGVFIRSLSARGSVGGLARAARDVARVLAAAGKEIVVIETVGVGQSEFDIMRVADTVIVVLVPEAGDTIQAMKAGLLEVADVFVVNKSDREGADRMKAELEMMLQLRGEVAWEVPVIQTVAKDDVGIDQLVTAIEKHRAYLIESGEGFRRSAAGRVEEFVSTVRNEIVRRLEHTVKQGELRALRGEVEQGSIDPYGAAQRVLNDPELLRQVLAAKW